MFSVGDLVKYYVAVTKLISYEVGYDQDAVLMYGLIIGQKSKNLFVIKDLSTIEGNNHPIIREIWNSNILKLDEVCSIEKMNEKQRNTWYHFKIPIER